MGRIGETNGIEAALVHGLRGPLPGVETQLRMAPDYRLDRALADVEGKPCREAAVLALVHQTHRGAEVLLIERPRTLRKHPGQVAFPGGRREEGESLATTALRETEEEVGIPASSFRLLGPLTPLFVPPSGFCVYPFVGFADVLPDLTLQRDEVATAFSVPLGELARPGNRVRRPRNVRGVAVEVPAYLGEGREIWGATAMMLTELLAVAGLAIDD